MTHVLAVYGKDDIVNYVLGSIDDEEKSDIESLVQSDPRAAGIVRDIEKDHLGDGETVDLLYYRRLKKLKSLASSARLLQE
ncbi:hypothetical protein ACFOY8_09700 [Thalassospira xianhensis]|uniref:Uncharacterized protein n=1 Tax=Thalassospira xianhensis MCCC 1A02616 TaxID=1177929 RepID=A0A367U7A5_9PROT|nr:hypothetical protein [Thalassospira xianhensis]RCK03969.1 hypothetical protein TH5_22565 [Thalassospira xianhensis MCCC 1A02616]